MIIPSPHTGKKPKISPEAFIAPNATIIGDVTIEAGANIWYGAVLRADVCSIYVGKNTSIQDNCVVHSETNTKVIINEHCIVGHKAMVHGPCEVGSRVMVGINAVILQETKVGDGAIIGAGGVARKEVPAYTLVVGVPAKVKKELEHTENTFTKKSALFYAKNGKKFREAGLNHPNIEEFLF